MDIPPIAYQWLIATVIFGSLSIRTAILNRKRKSALGPALLRGFLAVTLGMALTFIPLLFTNDAETYKIYAIISDGFLTLGIHFAVYVYWILDLSTSRIPIYVVAVPHAALTLAAFIFSIPSISETLIVTETEIYFDRGTFGNLLYGLSFIVLLPIAISFYRGLSKRPLRGKLQGFAIGTFALLISVGFFSRYVIFNNDPEVTETIGVINVAVYGLILLITLASFFAPKK